MFDKHHVDQESFTRFSLVGGVPKYWEFVETRESAIDLADELFFGFAPYLDQEPSRILRDEGIVGVSAISMLEAIGKGAEKPSEMAARLGTVQTNLSRLLQQLLDASACVGLAAVRPAWTLQGSCLRGAGRDRLETMSG
jgi:hypothetical protein